MRSSRIVFLWVGLAAGAAKNQEWKLPLEFEANRGQFASEVLFAARTPSHSISLTRHGLTLGDSALRMDLVDGDGAVAVVPELRLPGVSNYFVGNDEPRWQRGVPHYGRVRYHGVWRGIDLVVHGRDQALEYDFVVSAGADPSAIRVKYGRAKDLRIDAEGSLVIETGSGRVTQRLPEIYQETAGTRHAIRGRFRLAGEREVRFEVEKYDRRRPLVIDPTVSYSTYIGGTGTVDPTRIAIDSAGNTYITGSASSPDFPLVNPVKPFSSNVGLFRSSNQGSTWGAATTGIGTTKILSLAPDPSNAAVAYAGTSQGVFKTTNGGIAWTAANSGLPHDSITSLAVDPLGTSTLYACTPEGLYKSTDSAATWQLLKNAGAPLVVATDAQTKGTIWLVSTFGYPIVSFDGGATYFQAGSPQLIATSVAIDPTNSKNIYIGTTSTGLYISTNGGLSFTLITAGLTTGKGSAVSVNAVAVDKHNPLRVLVGTNTGVYLSVTSGNNFQATTGLGNKKVLSVIFDPVLDSVALAGTAGGGVYVSTDGGLSWTATGPANLDVNALAMSADEQSTWAGLYSAGNAFVTKINPAGTSILYSTYLGGSGLSAAYGIGVDAGGHAFVCGSTDAADFPTQSAYQAFAGGQDMFVSRLSAAGSLDASTFLGGHADDVCSALALDRNGNVYVAGSSTLITGGLSDFPTTSGVFGKLSFGGQDCVVAKFDNALQTLIYSTFLGGASAESCFGIAADGSGNAYAIGATYSADFLVTQSPFGGTRAAGSPTHIPGFVSKIAPDGGSLVYSALLGGLLGSTQLSGITVSSAGRAYVTGYTSATDFPVTDNALSKTLTAADKTFVTAIETDGSKLIFSTLFPGSGQDFGAKLGLDAGGNVWVTGSDIGGSFAVTADALPHTVAAGTVYTPWVAELDPTGASILHATYLGGSAGGLATDIAVGADGSIYLAGTTLSTDFPVTGTPFKQATTTSYAVYLMHLVFAAGSGGGPTLPVITSAQNGASFQNGLTPGAWLTIKGTNLSSQTDTWDNFIVNGQLPTKVDGVSVSVGGQAAYVNYISAGQINAVVPNVPAGPVNITVTNSLGTSAAFAATVQSAQPAFFLWNNTYAVATRQDFSYAAKNGTFPTLPTVAAKPGDVIILWGTGFGPTNPAAPAGVQVPASAFPTANPVTVTVGSAAATVYGAALAPGFAALYQVAIQIPTTLTDGDYAVVATVAGQSSPATTMITVQR